MTGRRRVGQVSKALQRFAIAVLLSAMLASCDSDTKSDTSAFDVRRATAAATALADTVDAFATRLASELPPEADNVRALELAREIASGSAEKTQLRRVADLYVDLAKSARQSLKDGRKAAYQVFEAIAIVSPGLAQKRGASSGNGKIQEALTVMVARLAKQPSSQEIESKGDFTLSILNELPTVTSVGLYMQTDADGRHPARERMQEVPGIVPPPEDLVDADANLDLPAPLDARTRGSLARWLRPADGANWLFEVADSWATAEGGLYDLMVDAVSPILYDQ